MIDDDITAFYNLGLEQQRLADPRRSIEYLRTMDILARHLPPAPARIADIGGGPGRYALALAEAGYDVVLLDPIELHVQQARDASRTAQHPLEDARCGDARELPFGEGEFDAVLLLGPLYHLTNRADRHRAWTEAHRVLAPGGTLVAAAASRYYSPWEMLASGKLDLPGAEHIAAENLATGQHRNPAGDPKLWTTAYFHEPRDLANEAQAAGLRMRALLPVEGPTKLIAGLGEQLQDPKRRDQVLDLLRRTESEPSVLGTTQHVLAVAVKPRQVQVEDISDIVYAVSDWIDAANAQRDPEALLWGRVAKVSEEAGEVVAALTGATGANPRKGQHGRMADVERELLDVAMTALCAVAHLHRDDGTRPNLTELLAGQVVAVAQRASLL